MMYDYLIIGNGIAGVTAAETIREGDGRGKIGILSDEIYPLYSRVLLPSYLKQRIPRQSVFLRRLEDMNTKQIDLLLQERVKSIDAKHREVTTENGAIFEYDKLLIASGGRPKPWGNPEDQQLIHRLQTLADADRLLQAIPNIKRPLIIGSSFISLEFLETFVIHKIAPMVLARDKFFLASIFDEKGGQVLQENFSRRGVESLYNDTIAGIVMNGTQAEITTRGLKQITADAICVGIGIDRNFDFLHRSEIAIGSKGILVNEFLETNQKNVFAAGDIAEFNDVISGKIRTEGNWTNAVLQGKQAGINMVATPAPFRSVPSYSISNLGFQITALGDCSRHEDTITRLDDIHKQYERFFLDKGKLIGVAMINKFQDKAHLARLIETRTDVSAMTERLKEPTFDIHTIPVVG